jgi:hypothetical protein
LKGKKSYADRWKKFFCRKSFFLSIKSTYSSKFFFVLIFRAQNQYKVIYIKNFRGTKNYLTLTEIVLQLIINTSKNIKSTKLPGQQG